MPYSRRTKVQTLQATIQMSDILLEEPTNSAEELAQLEHPMIVQGSADNHIRLNIGVRFGVRRRNIDRTKVESGFTAAELQIEGTGYRLTASYSDFDPNSTVELKVDSEVSTKDGSEKGANFSISNIGLHGKKSDLTGLTDRTSMSHQKRELVVTSEPNGRWVIESTLNNFLRDLVVGNEENLCELEVDQFFYARVSLRVYPSDLVVRCTDGKVTSREREVVLALIEASELGADPLTGAIQLSQTAISRVSSSEQ